jgi:hypothetical protein
MTNLERCIAITEVFTGYTVCLSRPGSEGSSYHAWVDSIEEKTCDYGPAFGNTIEEAATALLEILRKERDERMAALRSVEDI